MKQVKRINESQLKAIVTESVKKVLEESSFDEDMTHVQEIRDKMYDVAETQPNALAEAVNMFINELGDFENWAHFERCLDFICNN